MKNTKYLFLFACFIPLIYFRDFTPNNELKYLSIADEALREGHLFTFWNHGTVYADKPPLYLWVVMLGKWLFGTHSMFFLSLFSLIPTLIILYVMDKWVRNDLPANLRLSSQLMLLTSGLFTGAAIVLRMDMLMCLFILLSLYTFYRIYTNQGNKYDPINLPIYIFLAIFTKGPVGILVPLLTIPIFLLLKSQFCTIGKYLGWKQWSILLGLCILWFGAVYLEGGKSYLNNLLFNQTVNRAVDSFHHKEPLWYYFKTIWYSLAPWSLLYIVTIIVGIKKHLIDNDLKKLYLTIILTTFIALSLSSGKLDIYLLPIFPFIAYLSFLLIPQIPSQYLRITIVIPAFILLCSFPALFIIRAYVSSPFFQPVLIYIAALVLSITSAICLYYLYHNRLIQATNSLSVGLLLTILLGSMAISELNEYIGWKKISQKATTIAQQNEIENYYFYKFRSGQNLDSYLNQTIYEVDTRQIDSLSRKQNFILFVKSNTLKKEDKLHILTHNKKSYQIGDYSIIIFK